MKPEPDFFQRYYPAEISHEARHIAISCQNDQGITNNDLLNDRLEVLWKANAEKLGVPSGEPCLVTTEFIEYLQGPGWGWDDKWIGEVKKSVYVIPEYHAGGIAFRMANGTWIGAIGGKTSNIEMAQRMRKAWLNQANA